MKPDVETFLKLTEIYVWLVVLVSCS